MQPWCECDPRSPSFHMTTTDAIRRAIVNQGAFFSPYYLFDLLGRQHAEELDPLGREANRRLLRQTFRKASERYGESGSKPGEAWQAWYEELFTALGFDAARLRRLDAPLDAGRFGLVPISHTAVAPGADDEHLVFIDLHGFGVDLDRAMYPSRSKIVGHSSITIEPIARAVEFALDQNQTRWAIVAAGERLRLYRKGGSVARQYLEVAFTPLFDGDRTDEWTAFWGLFRYDAFVPDPASGKCLLDRVLEESQRHAARIADDLRENIVLAVEAFIQGVLDEPANKGLFDRNDPQALQQIFEETLYFLYRLLFVLYAESRDLLPLGESPAYRDTYSLEHLRAMAEQPIHPDDYHKTYYIESLRTLFSMLRAGFPAADRPQAATPFRIPAFNGQLFDSVRTALLDRCRIGDRAMREVIRELSLSRPRRRNERRERYSYADLGVDQLGSIYEGLLVFEPMIVQEETVVTKVKGEERLLTRVQADEHNLGFIEGSERQPGSFVLRVWGGRRKGSGSYYTPQEITAFLVKEALEPLVEPIIAGCAERDARGRPRRSPDEILDLKVCDPAMGSAAFLVQACRYLAEAYGRARIAAGADEDGRISQEELARFKRRIAERCLYGVDLNPMAVELAKVSLWLETLSGDRPLTFLDAHLRCGNALVGAPLRDGAGALSIERILSIPDAALEEVSKEATKAQKVAARERIKRNREQVKRIQQQRVGQLRLPGEEAFDIYAFEAALADTLERRLELEISDEGKSAADAVQLVHAKQHMLTNLERSPASRYRRAKLVLDLWCAIWFWHEAGSLMPDGQEAPEPPTTAQYLDLAARMLTADEAGLNALEDEPLLATALHVAVERRFFHWELELPEVFTRQSSGFDAMVGNPPWDQIKFDQAEFFGRISNLPDIVYSENLQAYLTEAFEQNEASYIDYNKSVRLVDQSSHFLRHSNVYEAQLGGRAPDLYRAFAERFIMLARDKGRISILLPSAIYSLDGSTELRKKFFRDTTVQVLVAVENRRRIFPIHSSYKIVCLVSIKGGKTEKFSSKFYISPGHVPAREELGEALSGVRNEPVMINVQSLLEADPENLIMREFQRQRDAEIYSKLVSSRRTLHGLVENDTVELTQSFNRSVHMKKLNTEEKGLPIISGRNVHQYTIKYSPPKYWIEKENIRNTGRLEATLEQELLAFRMTARSTDETTLIGAIVPRTIATDYKLNLLICRKEDIIDLPFLCGWLNSFTANYCLRQFHAGTDIKQSTVEQLPVPVKSSPAVSSRVLALICTSDEFGNLEQKYNFGPVKPAINSIDRAINRAELDALVADLYGLSEEEFAYILSTFPLLDRDQPALPGDKDEKGAPRSYITRDMALLELFKLRGKEPPADIVTFFAAAGVDIAGRTGSLSGLRERVEAALALGAVAYVPSGRGGKGEEAEELVEEEE